MSTRKIPFYSLVLLIVAAIDSIRNLPASALFGSALIFFFVLSAIIFLIPTSLVAAELSATFPEKGGVYHWVARAFGEKWAMVAIWLQWINTMVWYPTILSFIAGTAAYLINPDLVQNKTYLVAVILCVFWGITLVNLKGLHVSARVNNLCALIGTIIPMIFLICLGIIWAFSGKPLQITVNADTLIPTLSDTTNWISLIAIMASFLGIELAGVHVNDIRDPQRNFPKAILISSAFILFTMVFGSLAIAFVLPEKDINLVSGVMQVFSNFFEVFGMRALTPVLTVMIVIGSVGGIINWLISPAKGLLHAAEFGFLPKVFMKKNKHGVAANILIAQALLVSFFCLLFLLVPSVNAFYWFLTALSTELYMIMYILMFFSALRLHHRYVDRPKAFKIPFNNAGMWTTCLLGLFGCSATIFVSFLPPEHVAIGSPVKYVLMIAAGNLLTIAPVLLFYLYKRRRTA
ncbi:MAG: APC family permease [Rhabdochlamydiaceae bacterium]|nr:APC family permease [Rhabdochlamydiaceae bacterium]